MSNAQGLPVDLFFNMPPTLVHLQQGFGLVNEFLENLALILIMKGHKCQDVREYLTNMFDPFLDANDTVRVQVVTQKQAVLTDVLERVFQALEFEDQETLLVLNILFLTTF